MATELNDAVCEISNDGNRLYLLVAYEGKKDLINELPVSEKNTSGNWDKPKKVEIPELTIEGDFYGFFVSPDEKTVIISCKKWICIKVFQVNYSTARLL